MHDECVAFLQWALPRLGLRWAGFRKPRRQVCRRLRRRAALLGLDDLAAYRARLEADPAEWAVLDGLCRVTISRFLRDRGVWSELDRVVLPALVEAARARGARALRAWSAGCASGEEPYSVALVWRLGATGPAAVDLALEVVASDSDAALLERARRAVYPLGSLRELPAAWRDAAFEPTADDPAQGWGLRLAFRQGVTFLEQDVRREQPAGPFDLVLCRNLAFTYFDPPAQRRVLERLAGLLVPGGALAVGAHESPPTSPWFTPWAAGGADHEEGSGVGWIRARP